MTRGRAIPAYQLALIRRLYETSPDASISEIARLAGVSASAVSRRAKKENWIRAKCARGNRTDTGNTVSGTGVSPDDPETVSARTGGPGNDDRQALIDGLWLAVSRQVGHLCDTGGGSGAGPQSLMALTRAFE